MLPRTGLAALVLAACALGLSSPAVAQTSAFTIALTTPKFASLSKADCTLTPQETSGFEVTWDTTLVTQGQAGWDEEVLLSTSASCTDTTSDKPPTAFILRSRTGLTSNTGQFPEPGTSESLDAQMFFALANGTVPTVDSSSCGAVDKTVYFCVNLFPPAGSLVTTTQFGAQPFAVDSTPPATPTGVTAEPLDSGLVIDWKMPTDVLGATHYFVHVKDPTGADKGTGVSGVNTREVSVDGLTNGTTYAVTVTSLDDAGTQTSRNNESDPSAAVNGTPRPVVDFWQHYKESGGGEKGGCSSAGGTLLALFAAGFLLTRRRRVARTLAGSIVALVALSSVARADMVSTETETPSRYSFSLRVGPYTPNIDSEPALKGATPYKDVFGGATPGMWRGEIDVDLWRAFGRLSLGLSGGFWQATGHGLLSTDTSKSTKDTVLLNLWPIAPELTYRADFLWSRWRIPLVPFGRLGYGFTYWASYKDDKLSKFEKDSADGWARGLEYAAGLELVLDAFEPDQAAGLDQDFGIASTRLFVDFEGMSWRGAGGLRLDGTTFGGGLSLAF